MPHRQIYCTADEIKPIDFIGSHVMYEMKLRDRFEYPFVTEPTEGEHDYKECTTCSDALIRLKKEYKELYLGKRNRKPFPNCCNGHSKLKDIDFIQLPMFNEVPIWTAEKIIYTQQHVINNVASEDYYQVITNYIDYTIESFGSMPKDCGEPLFLGNYLESVQYNLKNTQGVDSERIKRIRDYVGTKLKPAQIVKTDFQTLFKTYEAWFKIFPFDMEIFKDVKSIYQNKYPFLANEQEYNPYLGTYKSKLKTKSELIETLISITNIVLKEVNSLVLYDKGKLTDPEKLHLDCVLELRRQEIATGYTDNLDKDESKFRKIVKKWLKEEKAFLKEIIPVLGIYNAKTKSDKEIIIDDLKKHGFFNLEKVRGLSQQLLEHLNKDLVTKKNPYLIALFVELGFFEKLEIEKGSKDNAFKTLSDIFGTGRRSVKGHVNVLSSFSTEDKTRYTSHKYLDSIRKTYQL